MQKTLILIRIFSQRGHCLPIAKKHLRPFAKRSILRVYLRYGHALTCVIHPGARRMPAPAKRGMLCVFPKTIVLVFHELVLFWILGPLIKVGVSDGKVVLEKSMSYRELDPEFQTPKTGVLLQTSNHVR